MKGAYGVSIGGRSMEREAARWFGMIERCWRHFDVGIVSLVRNMVRIVSLTGSKGLVVEKWGSGGFGRDSEMAPEAAQELVMKTRPQRDKKTSRLGQKRASCRCSRVESMQCVLIVSRGRAC